MRSDHITLGTLGAVIVIIAILLLAANVNPFVDDYGTDYGTDYGAVGVWNFEEGTGYFTYDQSPYGNDGDFTPVPVSTEQVIFGGYPTNLLSTSPTEYAPLQGGMSWSGTEYSRWQLASTDGVIKWLRVKLDDAPGAGKSYNFTVMVNSVKSDLVVVIADTATSGSNVINEVTVTGGDTVSLQCDPTGTPTARYATWTTVFEGDNARESLIMGFTTALHLSSIEYGHVMSCYTDLSINEAVHRQVVPTSGTIKDLYVRLQTDPGTPPDAYRFTLRKNGVSQTLTTTITADDITGNDTTNSFAVVAGDTITIMVEPLNTPAAAPRIALGVTFVADVNGESIVLGSPDDQLHSTNTEYAALTGRIDAWTVTEADRYQLGQECILKELHILLDFNPGAGNTYNFTLRIAGADSNVFATVSGLDTTGDSGALEDTVANDDYVDLQVVPDDTPSVRRAFWGFVCYIEPIIGEPTWTTGKFGSALGFTNTYIEVGNVTTTLRTLESWIYLDTTTEPLFELSAGVDISVTAGTLTATGFAGSTTLYVDGEVSSTVTARTWHYIGVTSDTNEDCTDFTIGNVGPNYLNGTLDQLRIYTEEKTRGEIRNHYLNTGGMYSGSVIVSDDFRILGTDLATDFSVVDGNVTISDAIIFDTGDFIDYDAGNDRYLFYIGDAVVGFVNATGFHDGPP